jgi:hypothetical protein
MEDVVMTTVILGRPKRARPTDRVNYKLDSDVRALLTRIAEREGRNEGAQVEQLILFYEAFQRLNAEGVPITLDSITAKLNKLWEEITQQSAD